MKGSFLRERPFSFVPASSPKDASKPIQADGPWRFYRMEVWPDLFGRALLVRHWGRLGTQGRRRLDPHPDPGAAINALAALLRAKRRRGYQDRHA
jgi:predicted DNA-binding WGR domain protein